LFDVVEMANEATRLVVGENTPAPSQEVEPVLREYIIGSWFLRKCTSYFTSQPNGHERLHLVTGITISHKSRTLDNMVKVKLASESAISALADQHELQKGSSPPRPVPQPPWYGSLAYATFTNRSNNASAL
jgi:hypothetical protein